MEKSKKLSFVFVIEMENPDNIEIGPGVLHDKIKKALIKIGPAFKDSIRSKSFWSEYSLIN